MVSRDEALREMARRELARRRGSAQPSAEMAAPESQQSQDMRAEFSAMTQNPARAQYDALPGWQKPLVAASDVLQLAGSGAMMGFGEKGVAALRAPFTDKTYEEELAGQRSQTEAARNRAGGAGAAAELTGAVAAPLTAASKGLTLAARGGTAAMTGAKGLAARTGLMGIEGAGYGALTAAGNDQDIGTGAALGAAGGVGGNLLGEGIAAGVGKVAGLFNKKPVIPGLDDINAAKTAAYARAEQAGVAFTPQGVDRLNKKVVAELADMGFDPALQPGAAAAVRRIQELGGQSVTLKGLDTLRKVASNGYIPGNKSNNMAIGKIVDAIDDLIARPGAKDVLFGDAQAGSRALGEARKLASRAAKLEKIDDAVNRAELRAASTGSGGNTDNAIRQNLRRILEKPRGLSADERKALEQVVRGTPGQNALRLAGKLSPQGNGLMAALGIGGTMVNPSVGLLSLGGMGAKTAADSLTRGNVKGLLDIVAAGGSRAATMAPQNAVQRLAQSERDTLARLLMGIGAHEAGVPAR